MFKKVIKNTSLISAGTLLSRILGFIRNIIFARFFGTSDILEAFLVAFRLPNLFRSVFAEGFNDSVATPVLAEFHKEKEKLFTIANRLVSLLVVILLAVSLLGMYFSRWLVLAIAPGFSADVTRFELAVTFTQITFFYLFLIGIASNLTALLYALRKFFIPALNPIFLNISFIAGVLIFSHYVKNYLLAICVIVGGILEVLFPYIFLKKEGFRFRFSFGTLRASLKDPVIIKMGKLFFHRLWSSIIYQINVFLDTILASLIAIVGKGALAAIFYSNQLIQLPFALVALSIAPVVTVDFSGYHTENNIGDFKKLLVFSMQNIIFFVVPIATMMAFIPDVIIDVCFRGGRFDLYSLKITAKVLFFYSFGLFFYCGIKLLVSAYYALKDTLTPAKIASIALLVNAVASITLMFPLQIGGVALGTSLAALYNFVLLYRRLVKRIGTIEWEDTKSEFIKVLFLSLIVAFVSRLLWNAFTIDKYFKFFLVCLINVSAFIMGGFLLHIKQVRYVWQWLLRKK